LKELSSFLDLTSLEGTDHPEKIRQLCKKALLFKEKGLPYPAAVCIYTPFIETARQALKGTPIRVATVAAAFPSGQQPLSLKLDEIRFAVQEGADDIDVVISRGTFLAKEYATVFRELEAMREITRGKILKVILETGELQSPENIAKASEIAIGAGADFIKTSTGKISPAATEEAVFIMLQVIREHYLKTGKKVGIKPAGGISDPEKALNYYWLVKETLGETWLNPELFRLGTSRLADRIMETAGL
jgi:deoxyribose-phosphate aldolase